MNYSIRKLSYCVIFISVTLLLTNCTKEDDFLPDPVDMLEVNRATGYSNINFSFARTNLNNLPYENLSLKEEQGLKFLREEEKVVSDFYKSMLNKWDNLIVENLSNSEKTHFNATAILMDKYTLDDPVDQLALGEFHSSGMQAYYNYLTIEGDKSIEDAFRMASLTGEASITSLKNQLSSITNNTDLRLFYSNLMAATRNHFRITVNQFERLGGAYIQQILTETYFTEIMNSGWDMEPIDQ